MALNKCFIIIIVIFTVTTTSTTTKSVNYFRNGTSIISIIIYCVFFYSVLLVNCMNNNTNAILVDMVAIEWNVGLFAICYLKGCKVCKLCMDEYFLHLFCIWYYYNFHN